MDRLNAHAGDVVSDVLQSMSVRSVIYCLSDLREPWGFRVEGAHVAKFHLVLEGSCWLELDGNGQVLLAAGELALLPHGDGHAVRDQPGSPVRGLDRVLADNPPGGRPAGLRWLRCPNQAAVRRLPPGRTSP